MATFSEMCPGIVAKVNAEENYCRNLTKIGATYVCSSHPDGNTSAYCVYLSSGGVNSTPYQLQHPALCK